MTVLEHMVDSIMAAAAYNAHDAAPPAVILWTDGQKLWEAVASRLGECIDRFYILSPEVSGTNAGPSTWIRYQLGLETDKKEAPVIYLPGVSRQDFRTPIGFPEEARHLFALQFLGQFWTQLNGKDWTPAALLSSKDGGLGLDLAKDDYTAQALAIQLAGVLEAQVSSFQGKRLTAADFNVLSVSDPVGMMLRWMTDPDKAKAEWPADRMAAFQGICLEQYKIDPLSDGRLKAAELLVAGGGAWDNLWDRFEEAPAVYRALKEVLALVKSDGLFSSNNPRLPQTNQEGEGSLRKALLALTDKPAQEVLPQLLKLALANRKRAASV